VISKNHTSVSMIGFYDRGRCRTIFLFWAISKNLAKTTVYRFCWEAESLVGRISERMGAARRCVGSFLSLRMTIWLLVDWTRH